MHFGRIQRFYTEFSDHGQRRSDSNTTTVVFVVMFAQLIFQNSRKKMHMVSLFRPGGASFLEDVKFKMTKASIPKFVDFNFLEYVWKHFDVSVSMMDSLIYMTS